MGPIRLATDRIRRWQMVHDMLLMLTALVLVIGPATTGLADEPASERAADDQAQAAASTGVAPDDAETTPEEADEAEEAAPSPWSGKAGLSLLATSGNTDTTSFGVEVELMREPEPWGLETGVSFSRAEQDGATTAERLHGYARGERSLGRRWGLLAGLSAEQDEFAGFDLRSIAEVGMRLKALTGDVHLLSIDGGLTWTREDLSNGPAEDSLGAFASMSYTWKLSTTSSFRERLELLPSFERSDDWRITSETSVQADLNQHLALKVGYRLRYDNLPVPGFETTDTTTTASVVLAF